MADLTQNIDDYTTEVQHIVNVAQSTGWEDAVTQSNLGAIVNYMEFVETDVESCPVSEDTQRTVKDIASEVKHIVHEAQDNGWADDETKSRLGSIWDYQNQIKAAMADGVIQVPPPQPQQPTFVGPIPAGAIVGQTKWLVGSSGCDMFCARNTPVYAMVDGTVLEVLGGSGLTGGDEFILGDSPTNYAFRYRHCRGFVSVGTHVLAGQLLGVVYDESLDQLCLGPVVNMPDGWQHCDLSVNYGSNYFSPQGGGGGNVDAYGFLLGIHYQPSYIYGRTPGPNACGMNDTQASTFIETRIHPDLSESEDAKDSSA